MKVRTSWRVDMRFHRLFVCACLLFAVACKKPEEAKKIAPSEPSEQMQKKEPIEVVLWHSYREQEKAALEKAVEQINAREEGVKVKLLAVPYDAFVDKITIATPRGQGPDLFIFAHNMIGEWVDREHILEPITTRIPNDVLKRFIKDCVRALVYKENLYGLPLAFKSLALFYDPELIPKPPETLDELRILAKKATNKEKGIYGLVYEASLLYFNAPFIHGFGGVVLDEMGRPHLDEKPVVDALIFLRTLVKDDGVVPKGVTSAMVTSLFNDGKAAMVLNGPWFLGEIKEGKRFDVEMLPATGRGERLKPFLGSEAVFLSAYSKHKEEAIKVMLALTDDDSALIRLKVGRQSVANERVYSMPEVLSQRVVSVFRAQAGNTVLMPSRPEMQVVWQAMDMAINQVVFGDVDPVVALQNAQRKVLSDIEKMRK
jgi:arabinogalactan oligomer/maltooligosaccharide transport system substrate-binding protein